MNISYPGSDSLSLGLPSVCWVTKTPHTGSNNACSTSAKFTNNAFSPEPSFDLIAGPPVGILDK